MVEHSPDIHLNIHILYHTAMGPTSLFLELLQEYMYMCSYILTVLSPLRLLPARYIFPAFTPYAAPGPPHVYRVHIYVYPSLLLAA